MSASNQQLDLRTSAAEAITNQLRSELLDGTIVAGSRILPKDLAERFSVSVVPVREALRHLEAEGLVVTSPQRATYAAEVGLEDLSSVYELRCILEAELANRAAVIATKKDRKECRNAFNSLKRSTPYSVEFFEAHRNFHWNLIAPAASIVARRILDQLWQSVDRYIALATKRSPELSNSDSIKRFIEEHELLASTFEAGDGSQLQELLIAHLNNTEDSLRRAYQDLMSNAHVTP